MFQDIIILDQIQIWGLYIIYIRTITFSFHACATKLSLPWVSRINHACNHSRYGWAYNFKYSLIIGSHNNWVIINYIDYRTDIVDYEYINRTILDGNFMKMYFIIIGGNYGAIDANDST